MISTTTNHHRHHYLIPPLLPLPLLLFFSLSTKTKHQPKPPWCSRPSTLLFFYIFWRDPGLRGLPKYVVNDGGSTRVDHENEGEAEEEEEEGRRSVEDPGGIVQLLRFLLSFHAA